MARVWHGVVPGGEEEVPVDVEGEDNEDHQVLNIRALPAPAPQAPQVQNRNSCCPKLWKFFFFMQAIFILFFLDIAFIPLKKYACNPFNGLTWSYENNTTIRDICHGHTCWEKQERCSQNCAAYQHWLDLWRHNPMLAERQPDIQPNPLCFYWDDRNWRTAEQISIFPSQKFTIMKKRAEAVDIQRRTAAFWNLCSLITLLLWFIIFCGQCTEDYKMTSTLLLSVSLGMYYCGNYLALEASDILRCYTREVKFNPKSGDPIGYDYKPFCDDFTNVFHGDTHTLEVYNLPPLPKSWPVSYYMLGIRAIVPMILIIVWSGQAMLGQQFFRSNVAGYAEFIIRRICAILTRN